MKKSVKIIAVLFISILFSSYVFAAETVSKNKTSMSLVKDEVCEIEFGTYGKFEKKMVNIDKENKTIDIQLTAKNEDPTELSGEVVLLIDLSRSMVVNTDDHGVTRKKLVLDAANSLVDKLYAAQSNINIGIVKFSTVADNPGSINDAQKVQDLTSDKNTVKSKINSLYSDSANMGDLTDIDAGLQVANSLFNSNSNKKKTIVLLTDGVPNVSTQGFPEDVYCDESLNPTLSELNLLKNNNINLISLLIGVQDSDYPGSAVLNPQNYSFAQNVTYEQLANYIFGTSANPKYGPVYYVHTSGVTEAISNAIYKDLVPTSLTDIVIKDYLPDEIINNFTFSWLNKPSKGTVSDDINTTDSSITWTIPNLAPQESTTCTYRLTLKDNVDSAILDKDLKTNKDVTIDCKEDGEQQDQVHNDKSPVVKLTTEVVPTPTPTPVPKDDTVAPTPIPQTGSNTWFIIGGLSLAGMLIAGYWIAKSIKLDKKPQ